MTETSPSSASPDFTFDLMDQTKTKDWTFLAQLREQCPVSRPNEHMVFTASFAETQQGLPRRQDASRRSATCARRA